MPSLVSYIKKTIENKPKVALVKGMAFVDRTIASVQIVEVSKDVAAVSAEKKVQDWLSV